MANPLSVQVVPGQGLMAWLRAQHGEPVFEDAARDLIQRLEGYRDQVAAVPKAVTP